MDFDAMLCCFAKLGQEFGVFRAKFVGLCSREKLAVKHVACLVERLFHLVSPLRFLTAKPLPETGFSWCPAFAATPRGKLWPLHVVRNGLILILMTFKKRRN